jgi:hypothetical protein
VAALTTVDGEAVALGTQDGDGSVWVQSGGRWARRGEIDGRPSSVVAVGGRLLAAGSGPTGDGAWAPTIWASGDDGRTWGVEDQEAPGAIASLVVVPDGDGALALGYSGPGELDLQPIALATSDGSTWSTLPPLGDSGAACAGVSAVGGPCSRTSGYPVGAVVVDGELLLAAQEMVTSEPGLGQLRTALYRGTGRPG